RHSGAKEGVRLNVLEEDIRTRGRWVQNTGKMQQCYLQKRPTQRALAIAGLRNKPFHLILNEVDPSPELQRMLLPFIETLIRGYGTVKNANWRKDCDREMNQFDPSNMKKLEAVRPEPSVSLPKSKSDSSRRPTVVFETTQFLAFKKDVVAALLMERVELPKDIPDNMLRALKISSSNQSDDMQELRKLAQRSDQSVLAKNMLEGIAKAFLSQQEQLRAQKETILLMQQAIDAMARQQRLPGSAVPGNSSYRTHPSELELLLRARPLDPSLLDERQAESSSLDEAETGTPARPAAPPQDTWFNYSSHHESTKSVFDEYQRYKTESAARLKPKDGDKHRSKQKRRQSNGTGKHVSKIRKICEEVEVMKNQQMQAGSLSEEKVLEDAMNEMDALVKFNSRKGMYTFPLAKAYCLTIMKEHERDLLYSSKRKKGET
ncbi:hypothetical protein BGZ50_009285, partial [Haplosporangium sp. Z 11]